MHMQNFSIEMIHVLVTGAASRIGYSMLHMIANGDVFGYDQPLELIMLDVKPLMGVLEGVLMELNDCAFPLLRGIIATADEETAFTNVDAALLLSAMPRKWGMERKDLLAANVKIVRSQGKALNKWAKKSVKVVVVGNSANTSAAIAAKYAPSIPSRNFSAMTRLDQNRAQSQIAARVGVGVDAVSGIVVWGNQSSSQFPDVSHASVEKDGRVISVCEAVGGNEWLKESFVKAAQQRSDAVLPPRRSSSALSAAKACCDHMRDWWLGTAPSEWVSMAVASDGSYGVPHGLVYSFPVLIEKKEWSIVKGLKLSGFAEEKMRSAAEELISEIIDAESDGHTLLARL